MDGRIRFVYATCGRRYFCIRIKKFADTKISGYVWTGQKKTNDKTMKKFFYINFDLVTCSKGKSM